MKNIYSRDFSLRDYKKYQKTIQNLLEDENLKLVLIQKPNGYTDVFAKTVSGKIVGEFFLEESRDLFYYVKFPEHFQVKCSVRKLYPQTDDMDSVIVDVNVYCDDNFNDEEFIWQEEVKRFNEEKEEKIEFIPAEEIEPKKKTLKQEWIEPSPPSKKKGMGCFHYVLIIILSFFLFTWMLSKCGSGENEINNVALEPTIETVVEKFKGYSFVENFEFKSDTLKVSYFKNFKDYKKAKPESNMKSSDYHIYFNSDKSVKKILNANAASAIRDNSSIKVCIIDLPYNSKNYHISVDRKSLESFLNADMKTVSENWNNGFTDPYVYSDKGREQFFYRFGKIK